MLYALENTPYKDNETISLGDGSLTVDKHTIHDVHAKDNKILFSDILKLSSNVAISKLALDFPISSYIDKLHDFGLGESTAIGFPGEVFGGIGHSDIKQGSFDQAALSYGYGMSFSVLQLARAYLRVANNDSKKQVFLIKDNHNNSNEHNIIVGDSAINRLVRMMEKVTLKGGTGYRANIGKIKVAGKTGTAYISNNSGYSEDFISSFAGFVPSVNPNYVAVVVLWEPNYANHFGGKSAAPIFSNVMKHLLVFKKDNNLLSNNSRVRYN